MREDAFVEKATGATGGLTGEEVEGLLAGDPSALARIRNTIRVVVRYKGYFVPGSEREDLVQEVLLSVWREVSKPGFQLRGSFDAFVRCLAHRRCVDWIRNLPPKDPDCRPADQREPARPDHPLLEKEKVSLARKTLEKLREPCRNLIELHVGKKISYRELSGQTGRSEMALRRQMSDCLKQARRILERIQRSSAESE